MLKQEVCVACALSADPEFGCDAVTVRGDWETVGVVICPIAGTEEDPVAKVEEPPPRWCPYISAHEGGEFMPPTISIPVELAKTILSALADPFAEVGTEALPEYYYELKKLVDAYHADQERQALEATEEEGD